MNKEFMNHLTIFILSIFFTLFTAGIFGMLGRYPKKTSTIPVAIVAVIVTVESFYWLLKLFEQI